MKKRILLCLLCLLLVVGCLTIATACKKGCSHDWQEATCTSPKTCKLCNETEGSALGHTGGTATCQSKAICTRCGETYGEMGEHQNVVTKTEPTCTQDGVTETVCSVCGAKDVQILPATNHKYTSEVSEATCTLDGVTVYTCSACGDSYTEITEKSLGHAAPSNAVWTVVSDQLQPGSTCVHDIVEETECAHCDEKVTRRYTVHKAVYTANVIKSANCTEKGEIEYVCACGEYSYSAEVEINANAHVWESHATATSTHWCAACHLTKNEIAYNGTTAAISAEDLKSENVSIAMNETQTVLQPDKALLEKMGDGVEVKVEAKGANQLPNISDALKEQIGDTPVYDFGMSKDGQALNFDGGKMVVSVPYTLSDGEDPASISVLYIDDNGQTQQIDAVYVDGKAVFEAEHFSVYAVVRMTAAERCAKLGHKWESITVDATCTEDGYTIKHCLRCGEFETINGGKATGHNFVQTVIKPTCVSKGYTLYACSHDGCSVSYTSDYVDVIEHVYTDAVVAPTCTKQGYTLHTCSGCGKEYKDNYVDATGHTYKDGVCKDCGDKQIISEANNFYFNLANSISLDDSLYFKAENIQFEMTLYGEIMRAEISLYQFVFSVDEYGYIEGKGEGTAVVTRLEDDSPDADSQQFTTALQMVFANKKIYMSMDMTEVENGESQNNKYYQAISQEKLISQEQREMVLQTVENYYTDKIAKAAELLRSQKDSPINAAIGKVVEYIFDKKEVANGYEFVLNVDRFNEVLEIVTTECAQQVFDRVFGAGSYSKTIAWVKALPNKTVGEVQTEVLGWILKAGLPSEDLFAAVNSVLDIVMPNEKISVQDILKQYKDVKISELLENSGMPADALIQQVEAIDAMLSDKDLPLADLLLQMGGMIGGGMGGGSSKPDLMSGEEGGSVAEMLAQFQDIIDTVLSMLKNSVKVSFTTTSKGNFVSASVVVDKASLDLSEIFDVSVSLNGKSEVVLGGDYNGDNSAMVKYIETQLKNLDIQDDKIVENNDGENYSYILTKTEDGQILYARNYKNVKEFGWNVSDLQVVEEKTVNGVDCTVLLYRGRSNAYILCDDIQISSNCGPTVAYVVSALYCSYDLYLYANKADGSIVKLEYKNLAQTYSWQTSTYLYYNTVTGKFYMNSQHNYVMIAEKIATQCEEEGFRTYRCTNCGDTYTYRYTRDHSKLEITVKLVDEKAGCAGGVIETVKCLDCGKVVRVSESEGVYSNGDHISWNQTKYISGPKCGDICLYIWGCACGEVAGGIYVEGECDFDHYSDYTDCEVTNGKCEHGYSEHYIYQIRCAVCGYTYTQENCYTDLGNCQMSRESIVTIGGETYVTDSRTSTNHNYSNRYTEDGDTYTMERYCSVCEKVISREIYQVMQKDGCSSERILAYYNYEDDYSKVRVYDGCYYIATITHGNDRYTDEGTEHFRYSERISYQTCSQYSVYKVKCLACDYVFDQSYDLPHGHKFFYDSELGCYVCGMCRTMTNIDANGAIVLEDLGLSDDAMLMVGYWNTYYRETDAYICFNYNDGEDKCLLLEVDIIDEIVVYNSGIYKINFEQLVEQIQEVLNNPDLVISDDCTVSFVVETTVADKDPYPDILDYSLTFTMDELKYYYQMISND